MLVLLSGDTPENHWFALQNESAQGSEMFLDYLIKQGIILYSWAN
jgi:hypothetical protein